jgi:copper(I)-binding protein
MPKVVAMLHVVQDGKMVMTDRIVVPAGGVTVLKPGGCHIMLFNMPKDLKAGDAFTLYITFARSGERQIPVKVVAK